MNRTIGEVMELTQEKGVRTIGAGEANMTTTASSIAAPILMYHRIGTPRPNSIVSGQYVTADRFEKQLRFLIRRGYSPMALGEFAKCLTEPRTGINPVAVTFDDGYECVYSNALPVLARLGITATVFVVAGQIGATNDWDEAKGDVTERMMTAGQLLDAQRRCIEIGSHTSSHPDLLKCSEGQAIDEICGSKRILETLLGQEVDWFSYPYGRESEEIRGMVRTAGYLGACGTRRGFNTSRTDRYSLARINMRATTTIPWLMYKFARARREQP